MKVLLGKNGLFPTSFKYPNGRQIKPEIHGKGSKLWNAFHNSAFVQGNDPGRLIRTIVEEKGWKRGRILEIGADENVAIPEIKGFEQYIIALHPDEAKKAEKAAPFATVIQADAAKLPFSPLKTESCNVIVWQAAMLFYVKLFKGESDFPLSFYENLYGRENLGTYRFLSAIHSTLRRGGLFIEIYPFFDIVEVPTLFAHLELPMRSIQFIERREDFLSESEKYYLGLRSMSSPSLVSILGNEAEMGPAEELARSPFSVMVIEKGRPVITG